MRNDNEVTQRHQKKETQIQNSLKQPKKGESPLNGTRTRFYLFVMSKK